METEISKELGLKFKLVDGKIVASVVFDSKGVDVVLSLEIDPEYFIDELKNLIDGEWDDVVLDFLKVALVGKSVD